MKSINFARVLRVVAVLGLIFLLDDLQHASAKTINVVFATEITLIAVLIFTTRIIELEKHSAE